MSKFGNRRVFIAATVALFGLAACDRREGAENPAAPAQASTYGATLIECPTDVARSVTSTIGPLGGSVELDGTRITLPTGAVLLPTPITLTIPASNYMEVDIRADGAEHFQFEAPVTVAVSYARCTRSNINRNPLTVWYIDGATKTLLENMNGTDDKAARTVTFITDHLSGYGIAE